MEARRLVPGDVVRLRLGDMIPADVRLFDGNYVSVDQSALTSESCHAPERKPFRNVGIQTLDNWFNEIYDGDGRRSIPPKRLLRAKIAETVARPWSSSLEPGTGVSLRRHTGT